MVSDEFPDGTILPCPCPCPCPKRLRGFMVVDPGKPAQEKPLWLVDSRIGLALLLRHLHMLLLLEDLNDGDEDGVGGHVL